MDVSLMLNAAATVIQGGSISERRALGLNLNASWYLVMYFMLIKGLLRYAYLLLRMYFILRKAF